MAAIDIITKEDLLVFKKELLQDLQEILKPSQQDNKGWLKSIEVRKILKISPGTLQNLRINGTLNYTKIGGIIYYKASDIQKLLNNGKESL